LQHIVLIGLVFGVLLSERSLSAVARPESGDVRPALEQLDQRVPLALAPLPLSALADGPADVEAVAPQLREPIVPLDFFRAAHVLGDGETLGALAEQYQISLETLIWVNRLEEGDALIAGQVLRIPRTSGVIHRATAGETPATIAAVYAVQPEVILGFAPNRLDGGTATALPAGAELYIPGGVRPLPESFLTAYGGLDGLAERGPVVAGIVLADETNLRDGPSTEHQRLGQLGAGRQVALLARHNDWLYIALGEQRGWLRSDLVQADPAGVARLAEKSDFPPPPPRWVWPARGTITSRFGPRWGGFHNGLDIANRAWTPIVAARSGVVREAGWCRGYGYCVKLRHAGGVETIYGHLIAQPVVAAGDAVTAGQLIGHMGSTFDRAGGGYSTGVHLHFTVIIGGRAVDPLNVLP
jgi:murein DD-endopeptidase MepM/ murein hydrolase activator NlpD